MMKKIAFLVLVSIINLIAAPFLVASRSAAAPINRNNGPHSSNAVERVGENKNDRILFCVWAVPAAEHVFLAHDEQLHFRVISQEAKGGINRFLFGEFPVFRKIGNSFVRTEDSELHSLRDESFQDVMAIGEDPANGLVGSQEGFIAGPAPNDRELT